MAGHGAKSFQVREKAAEALAAGESPREAAAGAGICVKTIYRWLNDRDFQLLQAEIEEEILEVCRSQRVEAVRRASRRLLSLIGSADEKIAMKAVALAVADQDALTEHVTHRRRRLQDRPEPDEKPPTLEENIELARKLAGLSEANGQAEDDK